ncbi:hypothetical protein MSBR3_2734 [Methanosarcina barkeri 3]|uniref:Uncharacterized protein n=1 Tax=Methanosarcina barkeri 3 TaxID=1434107 RepID=A0A0E3SNR0_METBA|nr:hypothetical protein MSBR3_2734 [Methanosarcina barkeri 3]
MNKSIKFMIAFVGAVFLIMFGALALSGSQDGIKLANNSSQDNTKLANNDMPLYGETSASLVPLSPEELNNDSYTIIIGTVKEINPSKWNSIDGKRPDGVDSFSLENFIYTDITISVDEYLKNPLSSKEVTVRVDGGTVGNDTLEANHEPSFKTDEKVLLYLTNDLANHSKDIKPEHFKVTGCMQGKFTLTDDGKAVRRGKTVSQEELLSTIKE